MSGSRKDSGGYYSSPITLIPTPALIPATNLNFAVPPQPNSQLISSRPPTQISQNHPSPAPVTQVKQYAQAIAKPQSQSTLPNSNYMLLQPQVAVQSEPNSQPLLAMLAPPNLRAQSSFSSSNLQLSSSTSPTSTSQSSSSLPRTIVPTSDDNQDWLIFISQTKARVTDEVIPLNNDYWVVQPLNTRQSIETLKAKAAKYKSITKSVLFCDIPDEYYFECISSHIPTWNIELLGLQGLSLATMADLISKLDFSQLKKIGIKELHANVIWLLFQKLLEWERAGNNNISVFYGSDVKQIWVTSFSGLKDTETHDAYVKSNYFVVVGKIIETINVRTKLQYKLNIEKAKAQNMELRVGQLDQEVKTLRKSLDDSEAKVAEWITKQGEAGVVHEKKSAAINSSKHKEKVTKLNAELSKLKDDLEQVKRESKLELVKVEKSKEAELQELRKNLTDTSVTISEMIKKSNDTKRIHEEQLGEINAEFSKLKEDCEKLKSESAALATAKNQEIQELTEAVELKDLYQTQMMDKFREADAEYTKVVEGYYEAKKEALEVVAAKDAEIARLNTQLPRFQTDKAQTAQLEANGFLNSAEEELTEDLKKCQAQITSLTLEKNALNDELNRRAQVINNYTNQLAELNKQVSVLEFKLKKQHAEIKELLEVKKEKTVLSEEKAALIELNATLSVERDSVTASLAIKTEELADQIKRHEEFKTNFEDLEGGYEQALIKHSAAETTVVKLTAENADLKHKKAKLKRKLAKLKSNPPSQATVKSETERPKNKRKNYDSDSSSSDESSTVESTKEKERTKKKIKKEDSSSLEREVISLRAQLNQSTIKIETLLQEAKLSEAKLTEKNQNLRGQTKTKESLGRELALAKSQIGRLEGYLGSKKTSFAELEKKCSGLQTQLNSSVEEHKGELAALTKCHKAEVKKINEQLELMMLPEPSYQPKTGPSFFTSSSSSSSFLFSFSVSPATSPSFPTESKSSQHMPPLSLTQEPHRPGY